MYFAVAMPNAALWLAWSAPMYGPPTGSEAAEAVPVEASIIATTSAMATRTVRFLTSLVILAQKGRGEIGPA